MDLGKVYRNFERRSERFLLLADAARRSGQPRDRDRLIAYILIELETSISYVARCGYLAGTLGGRSRDGSTLKATIANEHQALAMAARAVGKQPRLIPGRDEPSWHSAAHLATVVSRTNPSNGAQLLSSTGVFPAARRTVKEFRNFYAHRNRSTLRVARGLLLREYALASADHPSNALATLVSGSSSVIELWIWNYVDVADVICGP